MAEVSGTSATQPAAPSVAPNGGNGQTAIAPARFGAAQLAAKHGGLAGGRKRDDGLIPGSQEAKAADLKKDRERKQRERTVKKDPPPLPSAAQASPGAITAPAGALGLGQGPEAAPIPLPQWEAQMIAEYSDELLQSWEDYQCQAFKDKALEAKIPSPLVHEMEADFRWDPRAKKGLFISTPRVAAKALNKLGVPAGYQDEGAFVLSLIRIVSGRRKVMARLDKLIELQQQQTQPKNEKAAPHQTITPTPAKS
jgi:hypothetical protein